MYAPTFRLDGAMTVDATALGEALEAIGQPGAATSTKPLELFQENNADQLEEVDG